jgi:hypothetical protein
VRGILTLRNWKVIGAVAVSITLIGVSWVYAQSAKALQLSAADYSEIQELYANYAQALDLNQPEKLAATFTADGELVSSKGPGQAKPLMAMTHSSQWRKLTATLDLVT